MLGTRTGQRDALASLHRSRFRTSRVPKTYPQRAPFLNSCDGTRSYKKWLQKRQSRREGWCKHRFLPSQKWKFLSPNCAARYSSVRSLKRPYPAPARRSHSRPPRGTSSRVGSPPPPQFPPGQGGLLVRIRSCRPSLKERGFSEGAAHSGTSIVDEEERAPRLVRCSMLLFRWRVSIWAAPRSAPIPQRTNRRPARRPILPSAEQNAQDARHSCMDVIATFQNCVLAEIAPSYFTSIARRVSENLSPRTRMM